MQKITKQQATHHSRPGVDGYYYQLKNIDEGMTVAYAEFTGEHGERTIGKKSRIYYILEGNAKFIVNGISFDVQQGDLIPIPPQATYNLWPKNKSLKVLLYMEYIEFNK